MSIPKWAREPLLKSFIIVQIGGMGSLAGTVIAGLFIGLSDSITGTLLGGELAFIMDFAILMLILIVRPRGLFGHMMSDAQRHSPAWGDLIADAAQ